MKWFWQSSSGTTSGHTKTIVSEVVQLIEQQYVSIDSKQTATGYKSDFNKKTSYCVCYTRTFSDGTKEHLYNNTYITSKKEADLMYKHLIESKGSIEHKKTIKEKIIKID